MASQTQENLFVINSVTKKMILSPLIGMNKEEIIKIAKKIGTYDLSILPHEDCCSFMINKHPITKAKIEDIKRYEKNMNNNLIKKAIGVSEIFYISR